MRMNLVSVRVTHLPTGIVGTAEGRTQRQTVPLAVNVCKHRVLATQHKLREAFTYDLVDEMYPHELIDKRKRIEP